MESFWDLYVSYRQSLYHCKKIELNPFGNLGGVLASAQTQQLYNHIEASEKVSISGLAGSSYAFLVAALFEQSTKHLVWVLENKEEAAYIHNDLERLLPNHQVLFYPASYRRPYEIEQVDNANVMMRAEALKRCSNTKQPIVLVSYPDALFEQVITKKELQKKTLTIKVGESLGRDLVNEALFEYDFQRVDFVSQPGEFSVRGGIIDIFSFDKDEPYRIEFFGDEIDRINCFDIETQLSSKSLQAVDVVAHLEHKLQSEERQPLWSFLHESTIYLLPRISDVCSVLDKLYEKSIEAHATLESPIAHAKPEDLFVRGLDFEKALVNRTTVHFGVEKMSKHIAFNCQPQPIFRRNFEHIIEHLIENQSQGIRNHIFCSSQPQADRFLRIADELASENLFDIHIMPLYRGFIDRQNQVACYTDHQFFERHHKFRLKNGYAKKQAISLKAFNQLSVGDYVTHIDHGVGRFGGLQRIEVEGKQQEAIKLIYGERDILYVSIHSLHKISKYSGKDGAVPKIYKLGSAAWKKLKTKTKKRVKEIAFDLIQVYAKRKLKKGFQYNSDSYLQHELEASFVYEDTPDQRSATEAVKQDMESEQPMDRLVCGDVGFGKTEVAIRAAFKAVDNGKQVAILVPTTILAFQHHSTFSKRLQDFPVQINYLNRFRSAKDRKEILNGLNDGSIDIVIGTHQLVNKSTRFKNLGLLIVDEEQKFGVGVKEKLRALKNNVDVLTLTATPIPRTLQFSLMAARDLSIINTPPPNRHPIDSQVVGFSEPLIRDAIIYELQRGGQVFFVHNRVENLAEFTGMLQRLVPDAKVTSIHGQMDGSSIESRMRNFIEGQIDILVATTIIENGLDVPNANTIFINNAHQFGLSDLHQMRGRVGRSSKKAFCYFLSAPLSTLTDEARKRMRALAEHTALGSGFQIAMRDLEIRGAGDLLGGEQSGFINDIGFDTYQKILKEAIEELKIEHFQELYPDNEPTQKEVQIDTDLEILFPDTYINNVQERLSCYQSLNEVTNQSALDQLVVELKDRFGPLPTTSQALIQSVQLKWLATELHFEKVVLKKNKLICYFDTTSTDNFFQSDDFSRMVGQLQSHSKKGILKERKQGVNSRLLLSFEEVKTIEEALCCLAELQPTTV
jgi:transcription-repair coupling factor (superfamily II helicase)